MSEVILALHHQELGLEATICFKTPLLHTGSVDYDVEHRGLFSFL